MTHPAPSDNPHAGVFPDLAADDSGNVLIGRDVDGNPVTVHITPSANHRDPAPQDDLEDEGGEQPSASPTEPGGTALSTSSSTAGKPEKSGETPSPKPAPGVENPYA